jgi:hypothetical protein
MIEYNIEKMNIFKEKLNEILEKLIDCVNPSDIILLPLIFNTLKKSFYKLRKETLNLLKNNTNENSKRNSLSFNTANLNGNCNTNSNSNANANSNSNDDLKFKYKDENEKEYHKKNGYLLLESFKITCNYLDTNIHEDVFTAALIYIYNFFEDPLYFEIDDKITSVKLNKIK